MTNCFQGTFVSRATGFRVGLIKSRFCKVVLTQFMHEVDIQVALVFRSQWDVAALARVFYTLGVGNEEVFWKQFVDGGQIGAEFMAKAHGTLDMAVRDGLLLNFVKLGHLATTAVPFEGSDLEDGEFGKLVDLLQKMRDDSALPCLLEQSRSAQPECASSIPSGASRLLVSHSPPSFMIDDIIFCDGCSEPIDMDTYASDGRAMGVLTAYAFGVCVFTWAVRGQRVWKL